MKQRKHLAILGSTGSIGTQTLDVVSEYPDHLYPSVLTAHSNVALLIQQARRFKPRKVVIARADLYSTLKEALAGEPVELALGSKAMAEAAGAPDIVMVVTVFVFKQKTAYEIGVRLVGSEMCIKRQLYICKLTFDSTP